jgi:hypothetical protein
MSSLCRAETKPADRTAEHFRPASSTGDLHQQATSH